MPGARSPGLVRSCSGANNGQTPSSATLTVTAVEKYQGADPTGLPLTKENRVSMTTIVSLHDSRSEIGALARQFLFDFSDSNIRDVSYILRNFSDRCRRQSE